MGCGCTLQEVASCPYAHLPLLRELIAEAQDSHECSTSDAPEAHISLQVILRIANEYISGSIMFAENSKSRLASLAADLCKVIVKSLTET